MLDKTRGPRETERTLTMNPPLVPCPGNDPECIAQVLEAEAAFEATWRSTRNGTDRAQAAQRWRALADRYERSLAALAPGSPPTLAERLARLSGWARRLSAQ